MVSLFFKRRHIVGFAILFGISFFARAENFEFANQLQVREQLNTFLHFATDTPALIGSARVINLTLSNDEAIVDLSPEAIPETVEDYELLQHAVINYLSEADPELRKFQIRFDNGFGAFYSFSEIRGDDFVENVLPNGSAEPPVMVVRTPGGGGGANNKIVLLNSTRGYYYDSSASQWKLRVGEVESTGLNADYVTTQIINHHVIPLLEGAGAFVYTTRERSMNSSEIIINNGGSGYSQSGSWDPGSGSGGYSNEYQYATADASGSRTAVFTPTITKPGYYPVWTWFVASSNRVADVHYIVNHAGGATTLTVNQTQNSSRWIHLGTYYFDGGAGQNVTITSQSAQADGTKVVIADAVRFGSGAGTIKENNTVSGALKWQEGARYFTWFLGAPVTVYGSQSTPSSSDIYARPKYAEWQTGDAFVTLTTNSYNKTATGTESYIHNTAPSAHSSELQNSLHGLVVADIKSFYDSAWTDRGKKTGDYTELKEITTMPAVTLYLAFHDGTSGVKDNAYLLDPTFRRVAGKAIARGIVNYFSPSLPVIPDQPAWVYAKNNNGKIAVSWGSVSAATGYSVYIGKRGRGFADAISVTTNSYEISGLSAGETVFIAVASKNSGGESYKTPTVAARLAPAQSVGELLIVNGFTRWDKRVTEEINTFDFAVEHAKAVPSAWAIAGATATAVETHQLELSAFTATDLILGQESTTHETFSSSEQSIYQAYLNLNHGKLFVSGSEIGWDLGQSGTTADQNFLTNVLKSAYLKDDCGGCTSISGAAGTPFSSLGSLTFSTGAIYEVQYPDELTPQGSAISAMTYPDNKTAMVAYDGSDYRVVVSGVPFEVVSGEPARANLMSTILDFLVGTVTPPTDGGTQDVQDSGTDSGTTDTGPTDTGVTDTGVTDTGTTDTGPTDTGVTDTGTADASDADVPDADVSDTGVDDADVPDSDISDAGDGDVAPDVPVEDTGNADADVPDANEGDGSLPEDGGAEDGGDDVGTEDVESDTDTDVTDSNAEDGSAPADNGAPVEEDAQSNEDSGESDSETPNGSDSGNSSGNMDTSSWVEDDTGNIEMGSGSGRNQLNADTGNEDSSGGCGCRIR